MAANIRSKDFSIITLQNANGASLTNGSGGAASTADLDARQSVAGNAQGALQCQFELICQWATITGITLNTNVAEIYLVPKLDGTNLPAVDTTAGSSAFPAQTYAGTFTATKAPTASTDMRFVSQVVNLHPALYTVHIKNVSGQTMAANWSLKAVPAQAESA